MWNSFCGLSFARCYGLLAGLAAILSTLTAFAQPVFPEIASRQDAIAALEHVDPRGRASAIVYLGRTGLASDGPLLVKRLADENPLIRELAERSVWMVWSHSGDAEIDKLLSDGVTLMQSGDLKLAIDTFAEVIARKPEFAEGWNKRATAYFFAGEFRKSLADCDEVMTRNPQHFGALSGYGQIYLQLEEFEKSLEYFQRALAVNPNLRGVEDNIRGVEALLAARRRKTI